jgi:hypothetical protein
MRVVGTFRDLNIHCCFSITSMSIVASEYTLELLTWKETRKEGAGRLDIQGSCE